MAHPVDRALEDRHLRAETERDDRGVVADDPAADDHDPARSDPGHRAEQEPAAAERLLEEVGACLRGELSGHLRHRREQGQRAVLGLDRLVGNRGDPRVDEGACERLVRCDVQVREERQPLAQARVLGGDRLLHLEQEIALAPGFVDRRDAGPDACVRLVGERAAEAGPGLDDHLVAATRQLERPGRGQRDAVLVRLDLFCDCDSQGRATISLAPVAPLPGLRQPGERLFDSFHDRDTHACEIRG